MVPCLKRLGQAYCGANSDYTVTLACGGSCAGASKVCSTDTDSVHIGDKNAIGYFGYAYYEENANSLSVAAIANDDYQGVQDAGGAVTPGASTVANGSYTPLSRYIYMNVNNDDWDLVRGFIAYGYSDAGMDHVMDVGYVALPQAMIDEMIARMG